MQVKVLREAGYEEAMLGISLSYNRDPNKIKCVTALKLAMQDGGHNKFLESIVVWLDITAPRYWWQEFDTYRVGMTKQSESTMHTLMKKELTQDNFASPIRPVILQQLNELRDLGLFNELKLSLPEGFMQRRIVCTNYKTLRNMIIQRRNHKLAEWRWFIKTIKSSVQYTELLPSGGSR